MFDWVLNTPLQFLRLKDLFYDLESALTIKNVANVNYVESYRINAFAEIVN